MEDQILDFTPIVNPTSTPTPAPKKVEGVNISDLFSKNKSTYSPIRIKESDLGNLYGQDLSESSLKRYFKGDEKLESEFALTQSVGDRMINSLKITGANVIATSLGILAEIPDMISTGEIMGENAPIANGLFDWRNEVQKANTPYQTFYDKENPFKSILLPGFLTGSSKGWGTILETAGYGIGAGLGIAAQEGIVSLLTGGTGSIPALAKGIAKLVKLSDNTRKLAQYIEEGGTALKNIDTALDISEEALKLEGRTAYIGTKLEQGKDLYRTLAMSYSEAQMEALEGKSNYIENQKLNFRNTFGYEATGKDLEEINKKSSDVYQARFGANMLLLSASNYVSNKIFFGGLDKLKQGLNQFKSEGIEGTLDKLGNLTFSDNAFKLATTNQWWEKGFGKGLKAGVEKGIDILKKTPLALSEGLEEGGQFIIDKATNNYFGFDYNKPKNADLLNSIKDATSELFTSQEGQESMLLGILGGTGQQVVGNIAQFIGDKAYTGNEGYVPLKERKALRIKELNTLADLYNSPEAQAVNVNSVFGTLDKKFKNTSTLLNASGALDVALGNKELERRTSNSIAFQQFAPFVEKGMEDILEGMFKYRVDSLTKEEWEAAGITKSKSEVLQDFNSKLGIVKDAYKIASKKINPYEKNTQDYLMFEAFKGNYAFTLFQIQADVTEGNKIKQEHSKYFDVLSKFANKDVIQTGRSFLNTKTKEYKDRLDLLEQAESSEFTKTEKKRVKKLLQNYQELKDKFKPIGLKKEEYAKLLDELILTTNFEYNLEEDTRDLSEQISAIQDYLSIQDRIKGNLEEIKLMQGGSWEETKSFIKKKQKQAETLGEQQAEIIKTEISTPVETPTTDAVLQPTQKGTPDDLMGKGRTEPIQTQSTGIETDRTSELQAIREEIFNEAAEEIGITREDDLVNLSDEDIIKLQQINDTVFNNNALQTKEDFVQALNKLLDKFVEDKKIPETPVEEVPVAVSKTSTKEEVSDAEYKEFTDKRIITSERKKIIREKLRDKIALSGRELEMQSKIFYTSRARVAFMIGMESETEVGKNYKKALQDIILNQKPIVEIPKEGRKIIKKIEDDMLEINLTEEKPVLYKGKEIGTIYPSSTYQVKPEFKDTEDGKKLQAYIDAKDELYNSQEADLTYIAQKFNTQDTYVDVKLQDSRFTKFLYYSPALGRSIVLDKVIIERYIVDGQTKLDIIDDLEANVKLENGEVIQGVKDSVERDLVRDELRQIFIKSKSKVKEDNQFFVFMYGKKEEGQFINVQPINIPNLTKQATEELESYFDEDVDKIGTLLKHDPERPNDQGWNTEYALIDKSEYTDEERQKGSPKKTPNIKVFLDKNNGIVSLSLLIENQEKRVITKVEANGQVSYLANGKPYDSIEDILKGINPNYEIRKQKKAGQEYNHEFALANFKLGEAAGRVYSVQQITLTPKESLIKTAEKITTQVEMKPEPIKTPEPIIVKQEVSQTILDKIEEVKNNANFIKLDSEGKYYINSKTGKKYQRVTTFISDEEITNTKLLESSQIIGTKVDELVRDFFSNQLKDLSLYNVSDLKVVEKFILELQKIKDNLDLRNETVIANDIVLYNDEIGVAGTVDLLTYDDKGEVRIYDMKTMRGNNFQDYYKDDEKNKYETERYGKSKKQKHSEQLSLYKILLNNTHGIKAKTIGILPIEIQYNAGDTNTTKLNLLKGVKLDSLNTVKTATLKEYTETLKLESIIALKDANQNIKVEITPEIIAKVVKMVNEPELDNIYQEYLNGDIERMKSYILESDMLQSIFQEFPNLEQIKETPSMRNISIEDKLKEYLTTC